jgi:putative hydrolase of the HAD superfamily
MKDLRAVVLDFGGTLDSEGKHWSTQFAESFAAAGVEVPRPDLNAAFVAVDRAIADDRRSATMTLEDYVVEYATQMLGRVATDRIGCAARVADHFLREARAHLRENCDLLVRYRDRFRFAIVSNFTANLPLILEEAGLGQAVDSVVCSALVGVRKPETAIFRLALDRLNLEAAESAMIGDSLGNDIAPAKALGMTTVWLRGDEGFNGGQPSSADHVVSRLADALAILSLRPLASSDRQQHEGRNP